ncbi:MAG TPA: hypothetical protein VFX03_13370, partial [Thermomicrobiales bacterium]|nr:hypothetical protein [Thermomicrobiales bacterium]
MRNTRYRQPAWYRYVAGFAGPKPVVVVENPYGGIVPELAADLKAGRADDRFRLSLYEAAALGANMSVPYGAWLGSIQQDAFYPPHDLCVEIQNFLADHEALFSRRTWNDVALVYCVESEFQRTARRGQVANDRRNAALGGESLFWHVSNALCDARQPYDVLLFPEGTLRPDSLAVADLAQYRAVILPDCAFLTPAQADLLLEALAAGKRLLVLGELGANLLNETRRRILDHAGTDRLDSRRLFQASDIPGEPQVRLSPDADMAINVQRVADGAAIHLIHYGFDSEHGRAPILPELTLDIRLPQQFTVCSLHTPSGDGSAELTSDGDRHLLRLRDVPLYSMVLLEP